MGYSMFVCLFVCLCLYIFLHNKSKDNSCCHRVPWRLFAHSCALSFLLFKGVDHGVEVVLTPENMWEYQSIC